jgi:hypothetical protein
MYRLRSVMQLLHHSAVVRRRLPPGLEQLEDRSLPAPLAVGPVALAGLTAGSTGALSGVQAQLASEFAATIFSVLTGRAGEFSPTGTSVGNAQLPGVTLASFGAPPISLVRFSGSTFSLPLGALNAFGGVSGGALTPGAGATLPGTSPYATQDTQLSGAGSGSTDDRSSSLDDSDQDGSQSRLETKPAPASLAELSKALTSNERQSRIIM